MNVKCDCCGLDEGTYYCENCKEFLCIDCAKEQDFVCINCVPELKKIYEVGSGK